MSEFSIYGQLDGGDMTLMGRADVYSADDAASAIPDLLRILADIIAQTLAARTYESSTLVWMPL